MRRRQYHNLYDWSASLSETFRRHGPDLVEIYIDSVVTGNSGIVAHQSRAAERKYEFAIHAEILRVALSYSPILTKLHFDPYKNVSGRVACEDIFTLNSILHTIILPVTRSPDSESNSGGADPIACRRGQTGINHATLIHESLRNSRHIHRFQPRGN